MRFKAIAFALSFTLVLPALAVAQTASPEQAPPELTSFSLALQQMNSAARVLLNDLSRQMTAKDERIRELEAKCGDPCKPPKPAPATPEPPK